MNDRVTPRRGHGPKASRVLVAGRPQPGRYLAGTGFPAPRVPHDGDGDGEHSTTALTWTEGSSGADG